MTLKVILLVALAHQLFIITMLFRRNISTLPYQDSHRATLERGGSSLMFSGLGKLLSAKKKQVGSPTKARAGFIKNGLPLRWEAAVGFFIVAQCYSEVSSKRAGWQG